MTLRFQPPGAITAGVSRRFRERTLADIADASDADEAGSATFRFDLDFRHANGQLTRVDLTVRLRIGMPVWIHRNGRPAAERNEWDRFHRALRHHEDGHIDIFRAEAPASYERLLRATPGTINAVREEEESRIQALSDDYDHRTDHGRRQQTPHGTTVIQVP
jgi:predicted secreted Zn-dependent protease